MTTLFTPVGIVAYSSLFKARPSQMNPNKPEFFLRLLFTPDDWKEPNGVRLMEALHERCREVGGVGVAALIKAGKFRFPVRPVAPDGRWPAGITTDISIKSGENSPPTIKDRNLNDVLDPNEIYPGCRARASVSLFSYAAGRSPIPGVGIGLNNVQKVSDGPRLAGSRGDGSEFGGAGALATPDADAFAELS
jgi:Enterobacter phage Enc34, ssDNA-binding protein